jgi:hypothetical protein
MAMAVCGEKAGKSVKRLPQFLLQDLVDIGCHILSADKIIAEGKHGFIPQNE